MKEHGIIFATSGVQAILEGRKTQTRRVIKPQPRLVHRADGKEVLQWHIKLDLFINKTGAMSQQEVLKYMVGFCPYGQVGDRLWVKETHYRYGHWIKNGFTKSGKQRWHFKNCPSLIADRIGGEDFRYYDNPPEGVKRNSYRKEGWYKRSVIFMPRWASRITLEITGVRVERLQEITETDAYAEGCPSVIATIATVPMVNWYKTLWDPLNTKRGYGWETNPWVWVIEFRRLDEQNEY